MPLQSYLSSLTPSRQHRNRKTTRRHRLQESKRRVFFERLEDRRLLATFAEAGNVLNLDLIANEVQYGWRPTPDEPRKVDYFVQVLPERLESLAQGLDGDSDDAMAKKRRAALGETLSGIAARLR